MTDAIATVAAVRTGRVQTHDWNDREVASAGIKAERHGAVALGALGLEGDEQADRKNHGGPDKAVLIYAGHNYSRWAAEQGLDFAEGSLFENITLHTVPGAEPLDETTVRLGETWRLGTAIVQVSQPRSPCYKLAARWGIDDLVQRVQQTGWSGWYLRVLSPGEIAAGDPVVLLDRPADAPVISEVARILNRDKDDLAGARRLLESDALPERWRTRLEARLAGVSEDDSARVQGPS